MTHRRNLSVLSVVALAALALPACTDLKRAVGLEKVVPDEFAVSQGAPLAIPPDFTLRPPRPGAAPTQQVPAVEQARQTIFRAGDQQKAALPDAAGLSPGESELLRRAGAADAPRDIRDTVNREAQAAAAAPLDDSIVDKLLFWRSPEPGKAAEDAVINPTIEAERLKLKQAAATPATPAVSPPAAPAASPAAPVPASSTAPAAAAPPAASPPPAAPNDLLGPPKIERRGEPQYI